MPYLCMGLARFIGSIFFLVLALITFYYLNDKWELGVQRLIDLDELGAKGYGAMVIATAAGLVGLLIGQAIGSGIRVKNNNAASIINISWHYLANTTIMWMILSGIAVSLNLGQMVKQFFYGPGENFFYASVLIATIGSQLINWSLTLSGRIIRSGNISLGRLLAQLLPIFIGVLMGVIQFGYYGLSLVLGGFAGFIMPFILIPICAKMWRKDTMMRGPYGF